MRNDERFEIERAFDMLPHIVGSSWAVIWFRMKGIKKPTRVEYREKTIYFLKKIGPVFESYPDDAEFYDILKYIRFRRDTEYTKILEGENKEVEKRYDRYVDYG